MRYFEGLSIDEMVEFYKQPDSWNQPKMKKSYGKNEILHGIRLVGRTASL